MDDLGQVTYSAVVMLRHFPRPLLLSILWLAFCGCGGARARSVGDDTWRLECKSSMAACASRAEDVCSDKGFVVLSGRSSRELYGPEGEQVGADRAELLIRCGGEEEKSSSLPAQEPGWALKRKAGAGAPVASANRGAAKQACVPGATQRCVGPGACEGGQICSADGLSFGPCDCGPEDAAETGRDGGPFTNTAPSADVPDAGSPNSGSPK